MKIMVLSSIEWSDTNAFGNTVSNWFSGMEGVEFTSVYRRTSMPNNLVCQDYYRIATKDILTHFFQKERIGRHFVWKDENCSAATAAEPKLTTEKKLINLLHKYKMVGFVGLDDAIFGTKKWDNGRFRDYVKKSAPDIVFSFINMSKSTLLLQKRIKELCPDCKLVGHIADDVYGAANEKGRRYIEAQIKMSDLLFGASEPLCALYEARFGKPIQPLYKGCSFSEVQPKPNDTIGMVYAGNLYYGRGETLAALAHAIAAYNQNNDKKIRLEVYTATEISDTLRQSIESSESTQIHAALPYDQIKARMAAADINLHVESFEDKQKELVKYSFSTKIIDCMQSGTVLLAIGPKDIASVAYISNIPGAIVISDMKDMTRAVGTLAENDLHAMAKATRKFAEQKHGIKQVQERLFAAMHALCNK